MYQIVESVVGTVSRFIDAHGTKVAIGVVAVLGGGIVLKVLHRILTGRGSGHG
jgi:hypothetical protein